MLKVGLIGAGGMGTVHAECYSQMEGVTLVGIVDIRLEMAQKLAGQSKTNAYSTMEELIAAEEPDIIDICLPTIQHKEFVLKAAAHNKHVICEKPIAGSLEDADEMIAACSKAGVQLMVGHVLRFFPDYVKARDMALENAIGRIGMVRSNRISAMPSGFHNWYANSAESGGVLLDLIIHDFDWLRWTFGEVERVYAKSLLARKATPDHAFVSLRFRNGIIAYVNGSWAYPQGFWTRLEMAGSQGIIEMNSNEQVTNATLFHRTETDIPVKHHSESPLNQSPYWVELKHFTDCIRLNQQPLVTPLDAYKALEISLAAISSAMNGKAITLI